ncbi:hypothetical protein niasHT_036526 [Heterodera trifolii]|uniref:Uncharacterized protein n=1 Tax=Heterodera trifolii TaxID=157864 RepID=A0ABD2ITF7_9BILA
MRNSIETVIRNAHIPVDHACLFRRRRVWPNNDGTSIMPAAAAEIPAFPMVAAVDAVEEERRLRTVVVTNVPESKSDKAAERAREDRAVVDEILNATDVDQASIVFRVGKRMDGRPRPLKMEFPSKHAARHVIRMRGKVQALDCLHNIRVRESMTKEQLSERRKMIEECAKKRQVDNCDFGFFKN